MASANTNPPSEQQQEQEQPPSLRMLAASAMGVSGSFEDEVTEGSSGGGRHRYNLDHLDSTTLGEESLGGEERGVGQGQQPLSPRCVRMYLLIGL